MKRRDRLQSARGWLPSYEGKDVVKGYRKHFGVDSVCAFKELEMLGVKIDQDRKKNLLRTIEGGIAARKRRKEMKKANDELEWGWGIDHDDHFAYIAGHTAWGFAYGVTWEEMDVLNQQTDNVGDAHYSTVEDDEEDDPFDYLEYQDLSLEEIEASDRWADYSDEIPF
jgi:hypothetical protein